VRHGNGVFEAGCDAGFLEWVGSGVCRGVGCRKAFQVKAFFVGLRSACWKAYRVLSLISCCWNLLFCDSQVGNNNFLRRYMISA